MSMRHFSRYKPAAASMFAHRPGASDAPVASKLASRKTTLNQEALS